MVEGSDDSDEEEGLDPAEYPLSAREVTLLKGMATAVREKLRSSHPAFIRRAAVVLIAVERLPKMTPGASVTVGWNTPSGGGYWEWADISISEEDVRASVGAHSYEPGVGGDTESETLFSAHINGTREGNLEDWLERAHSVADYGYLTLRDEWTGEDHIDWHAYEDE